MERQQELKVLLKRWEAEFLRERRRKPSQADIEEAPPETRRLYEEYRRLKKSGKTSEFSGKTSEFSGQSGSQEIPKVEQVEDSGFWGSHLNRAPKIPGKSRSGKPRPGISVEFYGMKLKSKLGTIGKEPPLTPRRTPNPGRIPKIPQSQKVLEHRAEASPAEASQNEEKSENSRKIPKIPQSQKIPEHRGEASPAEASQNEEKSENSRKIPKIPQSQKIPEHRGEASSAETSQNEEKSENSRRFPKIPQSQKIPEHRGEASPAELPQNEEKSENPRRFPKIPQSQKIPEHRAEASPAELPQNEEKSENPENSKEFQDLIVPPSIPGLEPLTFPMGINPKFSPIPEKFQRLKEKVAQTLGSLDPGWIQRCQEKAGIAAGFGNSVRKRPREGGGAAEAPAQLRKRLRREPGIVGMGKFQEEREREGERPRFPNEAEEERSGKIPQKEEKAKAARKTLAPPGNFVRLNLKRKTYSRGFQRGKFLRKQVWKQKWRKKFGAGGDCCFRCGGKGHWAAQCTGKNLGSFPEQTPEEEEALPTLDEAAQRSSTVFIPDFPDAGSNMENSQDFLHPEFPPPPVAPLYPPNPDGTIPDPPAEVLEALRILGFDSFRPGQAQAIMRVLSGISTLVLLPTGTGKSLCYQLPAFLYHRNCGSISLVISPLVSLMDDQVSNLPSSLKAVCIHSNLTQSQREAAMKKVRSGQAQILLLSPESLVASGSFSRFFRNFPPIAFACLDEAHCISQWSHNFRPAYLRVCKVLRERLGVRCFLGLTATATVATAQDISKHLGIPLENGAQPGSGEIPKNLQLSVSMEHNKDQALLELLQRWNLGNFGNCGNFGNSVIVYCTRREESERLAALIQAEFPEFPENSREKHGKGKRRELRVSAAYHAGLAPRDRSRIQRDFMENRIRVLCATSALGMGLHKGDVGAIVHFGVPGSLERFLQEIGRAGRGGAGARGHLLMDTRGEDFWELRRHIHENSVDFLTVKTLIQRVFAPCKCLENDGKIQEKSKEFPKFPKNSRICRGHERSIPIQEFVESLDLREEGIETLLCLLELQPQKFLENLPRVHSRCRIRVFGNSPEPLREAALGCPPLGFLLAQNSSGISGVSGILEFDAVALSDSMGWEFQRVQESLRRIPWEAKKAGRRIQVEFQELSFHFRAFGDLNSQELDSSWEFLNSQILKWEKSELRRLQSCFQTFQSVAFPGFTPEPPEQEQLEKNSQLREKIREYFQKIPTESEEEEEEKNPGMDPEQEQEIRAQIREFLAANPEQEFSGRAVARIFHGIGSPRFPAQVFGRDRRFWRRLLALPFRSLARLAAQEILAAR